MVIPEGLEPPTYRLGICRSILMSYGTTRPLCPKSPQNANYHLLTNYPRGRINRLTCGALDLSMHKEKQAAGAAAAAADVGTVTVSDGGGDGGNASSTDVSRKRSVGIKHVV